jgi:hypothetical protein
VRRVIALLAGCASAFFAFYTLRLLAITKFLTHTRVGGGGAFVGAVVFPVLTLLFAWVAVRAWRAKPAVSRMMVYLFGVGLTSAIARTSTAQAPAPERAVGVWRGESICLVRPSACNDEVVVYRITALKATDSVTVDARKIVRGEEEEMGVLACRLVPQGGQIICAFPQGTWQFRVRKDSITGELRLRDNTKFRDVRASRVRSKGTPFSIPGFHRHAWRAA